VTPEPGRVIAARFRLIAELGSGNMGSVWLADHLGLGVRCAVKLMANAALRDPSSRARFQLEAKAIARLHSPHIVRVLDYHVDDDTPFIAMELLQGEELATRIARRGRLDAATTHALVAEVAQGLSKAHAVGIVHRDLKPENIFLAETDEGEIAKILDFGIAKVTLPGSGSGTLAGQVLGTPQYMSPEQVRGATTIDHRSDLWSLAVVTYHCLLGQLPFDSPTLGEVFAQILADPIPVPSRVAPPGVRVPPGFDRWWARAVSREVDARFASAQEMVEALGRALEDDADAVDSAPDITTPPVTVLASAPSTSQDEPIALPMRSRWRSTLILVAAVMGVATVAILGHQRSTRATTASAEAPRALVAAMRPPPTVGEELRPEASFAAPVAAVPSAIPTTTAKTPHAAWAFHASAVRTTEPHRPPPSVESALVPVPAASDKPPAPPAPAAAPTTRPTDDIDFGI
jgi:serine/threonine protein kinase